MIWSILITASFAQPDVSARFTDLDEDVNDGIVLVAPEESNDSNASNNIQPTKDIDISQISIEELSTVTLEEKDNSEPDFKWQNLRFPATPITATATKKSLFLIDTQLRIWELRSTGRWQISLDLSEQNQLDQEDLLLDAQSSFEEFLEEEDLDSLSEEDVLDDSESEMQSVVQSIEDELESAIFDPLRQTETTNSSPFIRSLPDGKGVLACVDASCFQFDGNNWSETDVPHIFDIEGRIINENQEIFAATQDGLYRNEGGTRWEKIPTAPQCLELEQKEIVNGEDQIASIFFAYCNGSIHISMDGIYWARKSEVDGRAFVFANTDNFPDSLFVLRDDDIMVSKDLGQTFSKLRYETEDLDERINKIFSIDLDKSIMKSLFLIVTGSF